MNIFFVDSDPRLAAEALVDQHVNKMVAETAQILSNCYTLDQLASPKCPRTKIGKPRKYSYPHHPCCKWAQESLWNFYWLVSHGYWLEQERLYRGMKPHFSYSFIKWCQDNVPKRVVLTNKQQTAVAQAFGKDYEHLRGNDPVVAYRKYYNVAKWKQDTLKKIWTRRKPPVWWEH